MFAVDILLVLVQLPEIANIMTESFTAVLVIVDDPELVAVMLEEPDNICIAPAKIPSGVNLQGRVVRYVADLPI
ncbi:MAG: hypothetical protein KAS32_06255 [Candidatus Peribacteraceae bacterium]|nr:hypothetical protein [Candidatus Peribacteraceae bacterium]